MIRLGIYKHSKGNFYLVTGHGKDSNNDRNHDLTVEYISLDSGERQGQKCYRRLEEFLELVVWPDGHTRPRFWFMGEVP